MNKEILTEIKRISQLMSINEAATDFIKGITKSEALKLIRGEIIAALKQDLKTNGREGIEDFLKEFNRATSQGVDYSSNQFYQDIYGKFAQQVRRELNSADKILIRTEMAKIMKEEGENILRQKSLASKIASNVRTGVENVKTGVKNITTKIKKLANGSTKELKPTVAKTSQVESLMLKIGGKEEQELIEGVSKKGWNWGRAKNWAAGLGVSAIVLWWFFHDKDKVTAPSDIPENNSNLGGSGTSGTSGSKYTKCSEQLPIEQYCKNETIRKVQACLAMPAKYQTGNFGPITQGYLERKGQNGTTITTETIIAVCGTNNGITGSNAEKTGYEDYTTDEIEYSDDVQNTKSDTPQPVSSSTPKSTTPTNTNNSEKLNLTKSECIDLFNEINDRDQSSAGKTATDIDLSKCSRCLQQYDFGIGQGAVKIKKRYGLTSSGGDRGIRNTKSDTPKPASPSTPKSASPFSSEIPGLQSSKKSFTNRTMDSDEIEY